MPAAFFSILTALAAAFGPAFVSNHHAAPYGHEGRTEAVPDIVSNDNTASAGTLTGGVLTLRLRAAAGMLRPQGPTGPAIAVEAFGEEGAALTVPGPMIRVPAGTGISAVIRNELSTPLRVHGLCERSGTACPAIDVGPGDIRELRFPAGRPGTYQYWATTTGVPLQFRAAGDTQLSGAFIVDPPAGAERDRVFVITEWTSLTRAQLRELATKDDPGAAFLKIRPEAMFFINGRAWPHTERLRYELADSVRWRVVNLSSQVHPMHLHGFYFDVDSLGDGAREQTFAPGRKPHVVTQVMQPGATMAMTWTPERAGNWLFHCHVMTHVSPTLHVDGTPKSGHAGHGPDHDMGAGMIGMVLGIEVVAKGETPARSDDPAVPARQLALVMQAEPKRFGDAPAYGFSLAEAEGDESRGHVPVPGPTLVLTRGEPVEISLINRLPEGTAIHWHGMELDSYYDGVHGWSGAGPRVTPLIEPGGTFVVRFTPPRAGTFMYHTHLHDNRQLTSGLYGAMLVLDPGERFDESSDHVLVIGRGGPDRDAPAVVNGARDPQFVWKAGARHRIRIINITPGDILTVSLQGADGPVHWQPLTKDGAPVAADLRAPAPARQIIAVGETYDFEYQPPSRQTLWLEVKTPGGRWQVQGRVIVK